MSRKRRQYSSDFKAKVALAALKGDQAMSEIAARFDTSGPVNIVALSAVVNYGFRTSLYHITGATVGSDPAYSFQFTTRLCTRRRPLPDIASSVDSQD